MNDECDMLSPSLLHSTHAARRSRVEWRPGEQGGRVNKEAVAATATAPRPTSALCKLALVPSLTSCRQAASV